MLLSETRLSPAHESDLQWLFCEAEGEMGLRSSSGPQLDRLREGRVSATQYDENAEAMRLSNIVAAASRQKRILRVLTALPERHQRTLRAAFGPPVPEARQEPWSALGTAATSTTLVMLTASRERVSLGQFRKLLTPPALKDDPDGDATPTERMAARATHAQAVTAWRVLSTARLTELRQSARLALLAASLAYATEAANERASRDGERIRFAGDGA